jgi:hypothetical protein
MRDQYAQAGQAVPWVAELARKAHLDAEIYVGKMTVFRCQPSRASLVGRHRQGEQGDCQ